MLVPQRLNDTKPRPTGLYGGGYRGGSVFIGFSPHKKLTSVTLVTRQTRAAPSSSSMTRLSSATRTLSFKVDFRRVYDP